MTSTLEVIDANATETALGGQLSKVTGPPNSDRAGPTLHPPDRRAFLSVSLNTRDETVFSDSGYDRNKSLSFAMSKHEILFW